MVEGRICEKFLRSKPISYPKHWKQRLDLQKEDWFDFLLWVFCKQRNESMDPNVGTGNIRKTM